MNNTSDSSDDYYGDLYLNIYSYFYASYMWVLVAVGVPGNIASVVTISTLPVTPATLYVALLAVTDLTALLLKLAFQQLHVYDVTFSTATCKAEVVVEVVSCYANWTLVLICLERFLTVCHPRAKAVCFTRRRAVLLAAALGVALFLCYLHAIVQKEIGDYGCQFPEHAQEFVRTVWYWVTVCLYSFLPFLLLVVFTSLTIAGYRKQTRALRAAEKARSGEDDQQSFLHLERSLSVMLVSCAVVFLVLTLPTCVYHVMLNLDRLSFDTPSNWFRSAMFSIVTFCLADATHAVNFYIYFLAAKKFRSRFMDLLRQHCLCQDNASARMSSDYEMPTVVTQ